MAIIHYVFIALIILFIWLSHRVLKKIKTLVKADRKRHAPYGKAVMTGIVAGISVIVLDRGVNIIFNNFPKIELKLPLATLIPNLFDAFVQVFFQLSLICLLVFYAIYKGMDKKPAVEHAPKEKAKKVKQPKLKKNLSQKIEIAVRGLIASSLLLLILIAFIKSPILFLFLILSLAFLLAALIAKYVLAKDKNLTNKTWHYLQIYFLIITFIFAGYLAIQIIQPISEARISEFETNPSHIQCEYDESNEKLQCYIVSEFEYTIDVPLFSNKEFKLLFPSIDKPTDVEYICYSFEVNPFYSIRKDICERRNFVSFHELDGYLPINIYANGWSVKEITVKISVREKIDYYPYASVVRSDPVWRSGSIFTSSSDVNRNFVKQDYVQVIGVGRIKTSSPPYRFYELTVESDTDLWVKGFLLPVPFGERTFICYDGMELNDMTFGEERYVGIDFAPREKKKLLVLQYISEKEVQDEDIQFNFTSEVICFGAWQKYNEIKETGVY